jgi:hypothetical protein
MSVSNIEAPKAQVAPMDLNTNEQERYFDHLAASYWEPSEVENIFFEDRTLRGVGVGMDEAGKIVVGKSATVAAIQELLQKARENNLSCIAMRQYKDDGTFEDVVIGGTKKERAKALAVLKKMYASAN